MQNPAFLMDSVVVPRGRSGHRARDGATRVSTRLAVTFDALRPGPGGPKQRIERITPLLRARGVRTTLVTRRTERGSPRRERRKHDEIVRLPGWRSGAAPSRAFAALFAAWIVANRPDVIHARELGSASAIGSMVGAELIRRPFVVTVLAGGPNGDVARLRETAAGERCLARFVRTAAAFVCVGAGVEQDLRRLDLDPRRVVRIPNGVDIAHFRRASDDGPSRAVRRAALDLPATGPLAITVGALEPEKRIDRLIAAQVTIPGTLLVVGDGPERERLEAVARKFGVADRVVFRAAVPDVAPLLRCADAYLTCADHDGLSDAVLEAMATGIPVVAADGVGVVELVDASTGVLVASRAPRDFAAATAALLGDAGRSAALGAAGRQRVVAGYTLTSTADELAALYRGLQR